jgi:hypothetical protein
LDHQNDCRNLARSVCWSNCKAWIEESFDKEILYPKRLIDRFVRTRKDQVIAASGREVADTSFKQAVDLWIEFL